MSLFWKRYQSEPRDGEIPTRPTSLFRPNVSVTQETAMRHSAVWACLRLRGNLMSTMPIDVFRRVNDIQVEVPKPPVLVNPGGERIGIQEWMYSTQVDLDRGGNCFGIISARSGRGLPARIDLVPLSEVSVIVKSGELDGYRIAGKVYSPDVVWHERQYTVAGLHVGLSPLAYAAWSIGEYLSIQDFALNWFGAGGVPKAFLRNKAKTIDDTQSRVVKQRFKDSVAGDGLAIFGSDWEYQMIQAEQAGSQWLEAKNYGLVDVARFFDCPADLIDAQVSGQSVTYANITQRNLQFLIMSLGPAVSRRETALSKLTDRPRYVKLNSDALLRMDPKTRAETFKIQIESFQLAPSEARDLDNRPPFTESQLAEFDRLGSVKATPQPEPVG